jgi:hypothetical protein
MYLEFFRYFYPKISPFLPFLSLHHLLLPGKIPKQYSRSALVRWELGKNFYLSLIRAIFILLQKNFASPMPHHHSYPPGEEVLLNWVKIDIEGDLSILAIRKQ